MQVHRGLGRSLQSVSLYKRGRDHEFLLPEADRDNGITYLPSAGRLRRVVDKLRRGRSPALLAHDDCVNMMTV